MIDALFGSKTRVKLLHLFLNNPGQKFYVREITRIINEQINSVRRELSNMIEVGIVTSDNSDNKLYYQVNQRYEYYLPLRAIFSNSVAEICSAPIQDLGNNNLKYVDDLKNIPGIRIAIFTGILVKGSNSPIDILLAGNVDKLKVGSFIKSVEAGEGREINYTLMPYDEFYYRLSVRDRFIVSVINNKHSVIVDKDRILDKEEK